MPATRGAKTTVTLVTGFVLIGIGLAAIWYFIGSWYALLGLALLVFGVGDLAIAAWVNARVEPRTGPEGMAGNVGTIAAPFRENSTGECVGWVRVHGETWQAYAEGDECGPFSLGRAVIVSGQSGLWLQVRVVNTRADNEDG